MHGAERHELQQQQQQQWRPRKNGAKMKFCGRPANGLRRPTALESFVKDLVGAVDALGEAERRMRTANSTSIYVPASETALEDRLFSCEASLRGLLDRLASVAHERPVELDKIQALLVHHKFRVYTDESVLDVSKMRIKTLCDLLARPENGLHGVDAERLVASLIGARNSTARRHPVYTRSLRDGEPPPLQAHQSNGKLSRHHEHPQQHQQEELRIASVRPRIINQNQYSVDARNEVRNLKELALAIMTPQARGHLLKQSFQEWRQATRDVQAACGVVWAQLRLCRQRSLAQAFGRWSRHAAFYRGAVHLRARDVRREHLNKLQQQQQQQQQRTTPRRGRHGKAVEPPGWDTGVKAQALNAKGIIPVRDSPRSSGRPMPWDRP